MNQKLLLTILNFYYLLYYTSRFDFLILCFLHFKCILEKFLSPVRQMDVFVKTASPLCLSKPSLIWQREDPWLLAPNTHYTTANLKVCSFEFPLRDLSRLLQYMSG